MQGVFRGGVVVAVVMAIGLVWSVVREKSANHPAEATAPAPVTAQALPAAVAPPPPSQPVAKSTPPAKPKSVLAMVELPAQREQPKAAPPPPPPPPAVVETKPQPPVESKPQPVVEQKENKPAKTVAKAVVENKPKDEEVALEEGMDLTFYREFQDRRMILPVLPPKNGVVVSQDASKTPKVVAPLAKPVMVAAQQSAPISAPVPLVQPVRATPVASTVPVSEKSVDSRPESQGRYVVQVTVLSEFEQAAALAGRLQRQGINAQIARTQQNGTPAYRVQVGPFPSREEASSRAQQWKTGGVVVPES